MEETSVVCYPPDLVATAGLVQGKFVQLRLDAETVLLFGTGPGLGYHNQILARFLEGRDLGHRWLARELLDFDRQRTEVSGGGRFRLDMANRSLLVWDHSSVFGRFRELDLPGQLRHGPPPWDRLRLGIR